MSMAVDAPQLVTARDGELLTVSLAGAWTTQRIGPVQAKLPDISITGVRRARIDLGGVAALDTAGAWLVHQTLRRWLAAGLEVAVDGADAAAVSQSIDLLGVKCPFNYVKTKLKLETMQSGQRLEVLLDDGEPATNVPRSVQNDGHKLLSHVEENGHHKIVIEKA